MKKVLADATVSKPRLGNGAEVSSAFWTLCIADPIFFVRTMLGVEKLEGYQEEFLNNVAKFDRVAFRSGHGVGKTFIVACVILWFLFTRPCSKVISTAPTWRQVRKILWAEIKTRYNASNLSKALAQVLDTELRLASDWFAVGESSDDPHKLEGFHADDVLFVVDEAKAVPNKTLDAIEGSQTGKGAKLIYISTPASRTGGFYEVFMGKRKGWKCMHVSCLDSARVSPEWIEARRLQWGENNPVYQARVLGNFPDEGEDSLIPLSWVEAAIVDDENDMPKLAAKSDDKTIQLGCDVARFGSNFTVLTLRQGQAILSIEKYGKESVMFTAGRVMTYVRESMDNGGVVVVDDTGLGGGVTDRLRELNCPWVVPAIMGASALDRETFANVEMEAYWQLRKRFEGKAISIPDDYELIGQLASIKYTYTSDGRLKLVKPSGPDSPDKADSLCLAFMDVAGGGDWMMRELAQSRETIHLMGECVSVKGW